MAEIEKVLTELDRLKLAIKMEDSDRGKMNIMPCISTIDEAIQTIRELQSKSEEVCEWKYISSVLYDAYIKCRGKVMNIRSMRYYKYCPYCGRKIKVVE